MASSASAEETPQHTQAVDDVLTDFEYLLQSLDFLTGFCNDSAAVHLISGQVQIAEHCFHHFRTQQANAQHHDRPVSQRRALPGQPSHSQEGQNYRSSTASSYSSSTLSNSPPRNASTQTSGAKLYRRDFLSSEQIEHQKLINSHAQLLKEVRELKHQKK